MEVKRWHFSVGVYTVYLLCNEVMQLFCFDFLCQCTASRKKEIKNGTRVQDRLLLRSGAKIFHETINPKSHSKCSTVHTSTLIKIFFHISYLLLALALKNYFLLLRQFNLQSGTQKCLPIYNFYWTLKLGLQNSSSTSQRLLWMENYVLNEQKKSLKLWLSFFFNFYFKRISTNSNPRWKGK